MACDAHTVFVANPPSCGTGENVASRSSRAASAVSCRTARRGLVCHRVERTSPLRVGPGCHLDGQRTHACCPLSSPDEVGRSNGGGAHRSFWFRCCRWIHFEVERRQRRLERRSSEYSAGTRSSSGCRDMRRLIGCERLYGARAPHHGEMGRRARRLAHQAPALIIWRLQRRVATVGGFSSSR